MATFEELMETFRNPGENGLPENFAEELTSTYQQDLSIRDAAVTERETRITEAQSRIAAAEAESVRLKAVNYDLLMAAPKAGDNSADNEEDNANEKRGVDSLFE